MRMMTKLLALMLALMLTACTALAEDVDQLSDIQSKGEIVVATEGAWAPWTYHDENGTLVGFDVEVAQAIAAKLGVTATFAETEWDGIFAGLDSGRYDIAANGVEVTEERARKYDFSTPYGYIRTALIVLSSILSATVTAFAGPISFVGIAVPFLIRHCLNTSKPLVVIPATFLGGGVFCMLCDLIARTAFAPTELNISTVTSIFGAPVVIYMMLRRKGGRK